MTTQKVGKNLLNFVRQVNGKEFIYWNSGSGGRQDYDNPLSDWQKPSEQCKYIGKDKIIYLN